MSIRDEILRTYRYTKTLPRPVDATNMSREALLAGGALVVFVTTLLAVGVVPGILAQPADDIRQSRLAVDDTTLSASQVGGESATLQITTYLRHAGGPAENVTVVYRAVDTDTGLLATTVERDVGSVTTGGERAVTGNITVDRQGGYRIETIVYQDAQRVETTRTTVNGVGSLQPDFARSSVRFHSFEGLADIPAVQYSIAEVSGNRTTLEVSTLLTNAGSESAGGVRVIVQARQAESNIVADTAEIQVGDVSPGATVRPDTSMTVPDGYNYYLDAILYKDGVIVGTAQSAANLDPTETISTNETRRDVSLEVEDFEREREQRAGEASPTEVAEAQEPGFGVAVAIAGALLGVGLLVTRRWSP